MTYVGYHLGAFFYGPIQFFFGIGFMYIFVGVSFVAAIAVTMLLVLFTYFISKVTSRINEKVLEAKDARMVVTQ